MYPLQFITSNMPLAAMPASALQLPTVGREPTSRDSLPTASEMPAPPTTTKQWHCLSDQEETIPKPEEEESMGLDVTPKKWPHYEQKKGRLPVRPLRESCLEAFLKDSDLIWVMGWTYFKMHHPNYDHEGSQDFSHTFKEMATSASLIGSDVHEVQEVWTGWKDLWVIHHTVQSSSKDIHFF